MGVASAKYGKWSINGGTSAMASVREVSIDYQADLPEGGMSSANQGAPVAVLGPKDFTGEVQIYGKTFNQLPGDTFSFEAYNGTEVATGAAIVESCDLRCSIQSGGLLSGSIKFGGNGALTIGSGGTSQTDATLPQAFPSVVCKAAWGPLAASPTMADIAGVTEWTLQYSRNINDYVTSDSSGWKSRNGGALRGLEATVSVLNSAPSGLQTANMLPGQFGELRLYVTATEYFAVRWAGVTGLRESVPIETGRNVELQASLKWSSYYPISGTMTVGYIKNPAAATIWP